MKQAVKIIAFVGVLPVLLMCLCSGCLMAWPYALVTDYEEYYGLQKETHGTQEILTLPGADWARFPIVPGVVHYRRKRANGTLLVRERRFDREKTTSQVIFDSLVIEHANGEGETIITPDQEVSERTFAFVEPWIPICTFRLDEDDIVVKMSGRYSQHGAEPQTFSLSKPWHYAEGVKCSREYWYRGE